jgi:two-component system, sensor histidine kinase LadS
MNKAIRQILLGILVWLLYFGYSGPVYAQQLVLKSAEVDYRVEYPFYLVDGKGDMNISTVVNEDRHFKPSAFPVLSLGATTSSVWIRVNVVNQTVNSEWYFQISSPPVLHTLEIYRKDIHGIVKIFSKKIGQDQITGNVKVNNLLIPISADKETTYYIKASSHNILRVPLKVITLQKAFEQAYLTDLFNALTFGILVAFAVYNLFVFLLTKELPYIYYLGYTFFWGLNLFFYNGFISDFFSFLPWLNRAGMIIAIASIFSVYFTNSFLQTKKYCPFFFKLRWIMLAISLIALIIDVFWEGAYAFIYIQYCMYPFFVYWIGAGLQSLKNGYKPALYFVLGFGCFILGNAVYNLKDLDVLPDNTFTQSSMHWGAILDALILSFALANRLSFYHKEKEQIQLRSIEEKSSFLKELLHRQEHEKKRVAMELHDNIGQQLILIKNRSWRLYQLSADSVKGQVMSAILQIAAIMAEVRNMLHRLRPYQMDLLGLTQSIHSLIAEAFTDYKIDRGEVADIDSFFAADEAIHIFRIIQLLTDYMLESAQTNQVFYAIHHQSSRVEFLFSINIPQKTFDDHSDISNRLELLNGHISVQNRLDNCIITVSIPCSII